MKKFKAILALVLVAALFCTLFAACAKTEETPAANNNTSSNANTNTSAPADTDDGEDAETPDVDEPTEWDPEDWSYLNMFFFDLRMVGADHGERIQQAVNEYIGSKYGVQLNMTFFTIGDWMTKVQIALAGGEQVDVMPLCFGNGVQTLYTNTMLTDITDYMAEYAPETMEMMKDYLGTYSYDGRLYGVPTYRGYCTNSYIIMRKDILDELGMTDKARNMSSWTEFEEIMGAVAENYTAETGLYATSKGAGKSCAPAYLWNGDNFSDLVEYDNLGDATAQIMTDTEGHVLWLVDDPRFEEKLQRVATWRENGWIWPDSALVETHGDELFKQNVTFSDLDESEYGVEAVKSANCGHELVCVEYAPGWVMTATLTKTGIGVPITAEEPEAACRFINALYLDEHLMDMLIRGIEGTDYEVVDGEISYIGDSYYYEADFVMGNNTLLKPLKGQGADYFEQIIKINEAAHISEYLGCAIDTSNLQNEIANVTAVYNQYYGDLYTGNYTPEMLQEYKDKLKAAGVDDLINAYQTQLDAFLGK